MSQSPAYYPAWKGYERLAFRVAFIYFILQALPLDWKYFRYLFSVNWTDLHFQDLFGLTTYMPQFFSAGDISKWGIASYANWGIVLIIAIIGAAIWSYADRKRQEYNTLYYLLRVLLRYRLAIGIIGYGVIKLFPVEMPSPSLSDLHNNYGDLLPWKAYALTTAVANAHYESTLGLIEITGGILLLYRKTVTIGAGIITALLINVVIVNFAYEIGEHVYSAYLLVIALFLLLYDTPRLYNLLVKHRLALANRFKPVFFESNLKKLRALFRAAFILFIVLYGYKTYAGYHHDHYPYPKTTGLKDAYGYYNVKEFRLNNQVLPYSLTDSLRWQDLVFEKWNTLSIKSTRYVSLDPPGSAIEAEKDIDRDYESTGIGRRHYYNYLADTLKHILYLQDKNKYHREEKLVLEYSRPDQSTLILSGKNEKQDSVYVVLEKINKKYLLIEGRRKPIKIY
jgi:hypothetical protein